MWLQENSLLKKKRSIFEFFVSARFLKLDKIFNYGSENNTDLPMTQNGMFVLISSYNSIISTLFHKTNNNILNGQLKNYKI